MDNRELYHHGILGMKWGIRRYQPYGKGGYNPEHSGKNTGSAKKASAKQTRKEERAKRKEERAKRKEERAKRNEMINSHVDYMEEYQETSEGAKKI